MFRIIRVTGASLSPDYVDGDYVVLVTIPFLLNKIKPGDIVVFQQAYYGLMIKKVEAINEKGDSLFLVGTHQDSVDSRRFGSILKQDILGKVLWHIRKPTT